MEKLNNDTFADLLAPILLDDEEILFTLQDDLMKPKALVFTDRRMIKFSYYPGREEIAELRCRSLTSIKMFSMVDETDHGRSIRTMLYLYAYSSENSDMIAFTDKELAVSVCRFLSEKIWGSK